MRDARSLIANKLCRGLSPAGHVLFLAAIMCLAPATAGAVAGGPITGIVLLRPGISVDADKVTVTCRLGLQPLAAVRDQLRDGARMELAGGITLFAKRTLLPDSEQAAFPIRWILYYAPLTRDFVLVSAEAQKNAVYRAHDLETLLREAWGSLEAVLPPEEPLADGQEYLVRIALTLKYAAAPPWLEKALFFLSRELAPPLVFEQRFTFEPG
jgi:hypothetical protein